MDSETCQRLYDAYYMRVFSYVMTLCGDRNSAEEITQDTFFRAFYKSTDYRKEADEVTWLCAIAKNRFLDEKRKQGRMTEMPEELPADGNIELEAVSKDSSFRIHVALHGLEDPYREIFELRVFGELSFQQIGTIFGKTENWARVTYHRARLKLQERMSDQ